MKEDLPARNTGRNINPWISPSVTIPKTILKKILNNSLLEKAVTITPMNVETPLKKKNGKKYSWLFRLNMPCK